MQNQKKQFGWKRKIGANVSKSASSAFEDDAKDDDETEEVDWLSLVPLKKTRLGLEDANSKSARLVQEGTVLASSERYWEAMRKWDEALLYTPGDGKIHEMKAQVLMELCEVYPAVQTAMKAVECNPTWWIAHQTLGRAHLGLGEVKMALKSFSRAVHLNPDNRELWEDDLMWAYSLLQKKHRLDDENRKEAPSSSVTITELDKSEDDEDLGDSDSNSRVDIYINKHNRSKSTGKVEDENSESLKRLPNNYIQMREPT